MSYDLIGYDRTSPKSIENYSQLLINKTFSELLATYSQYVEAAEASPNGSVYSDNADKGSLGKLIEERFFHLKSHSDARPDFQEAEVELKVTPFRKNRSGTLSAKERLIITMIDYMSVIEESFENSHLWEKAKQILLVFYLYEELADRLDYRIHYAKIFTPPLNDIAIIKQDFEFIKDKIKSGNAHELSGGDTLYLEAATKSSDSSVRREQPCNIIRAKPRAFAYKSSYMTYILNSYIAPQSQKIEAILKSEISTSFEDYVIGQISNYTNLSVEELCSHFGISPETRPKHLGALLAYRMLGISGNKAEEFVKANIIVKTIRINKRGKIKESMSFPTFRFTEIIEEEWETSALRDYLSTTKFFFVVFKEDSNDVLHLEGGQFWNIPVRDLDEGIKKVWERARLIISNGIKTKVKNGRTTNNLPKSSESNIAHVRPHARNAKDTYELPTGGAFPKQCFWLNNDYIYSQLDSQFRESRK
jgi:DNA mismatch repair protein MutH